MSLHCAIMFEVRLLMPAQQVGGQYLGIYSDDLKGDLEINLGQAAGWIDLPNAALAGATPRSLLDTPTQRAFRDMILDQVHGNMA